MLGSLDPAKLLVVLVFALVVLGPERLPRAARQLGAAWRELTRIRQQVTDEVRSALPDLGLDDLDLPHIPRNPSAAVSGFMRDLTGSLVGEPSAAAGARRNGNKARSSSSTTGADASATLVATGAADGGLLPAGGQRPRRLRPGEPVPEHASLVVVEPRRGELAVVFDDPAMN